jgi:hypothetical protein
MAGNRPEIRIGDLAHPVLSEQQRGALAWADSNPVELLERCVRDLELVPAERRFDVPFHEFMEDDVAMVERIYDHVGLDTTARSEIERYMAAHPRGKGGQIRYDLRADFGVEPADIRARFGFYTDRFPVVTEVF